MNHEQRDSFNTTNYHIITHGAFEVHSDRGIFGALVYQPIMLYFLSKKARSSAFRYKKQILSILNRTRFIKCFVPKTRKKFLS